MHMHPSYESYFFVMGENIKKQIMCGDLYVCQHCGCLSQQKRDWITPLYIAGVGAYQVCSSCGLRFIMGFLITRPNEPDWTYLVEDKGVRTVYHSWDQCVEAAEISKSVSMVGFLKAPYRDVKSVYWDALLHRGDQGGMSAVTLSYYCTQLKRMFEKQIYDHLQVFVVWRGHCCLSPSGDVSYLTCITLNQFDEANIRARLAETERSLGIRADTPFWMMLEERELEQYWGGSVQSFCFPETDPRLVLCTTLTDLRQKRGEHDHAAAREWQPTPQFLDMLLHRNAQLLEWHAHEQQCLLQITHHYQLLKQKLNPS